MSSSRCVMLNLDNPLLNGIALGLTQQDDGQLGVQASMFPCCAAEGMAWDEVGRGYYNCQVRSRLRRVQQLMQLFRKYWPNATRSPHQVPPAWGGQVLQELASMLRRDIAPAAVIYSQQRQQPSVLWSKALAAAWRFGIEARVLHLHEANLSELAAFTRDAEGPLALFIEQADKLWDPLYAERLEYIVQRAYNGEAMLWIDFVMGSTPTADPQDDSSLKATLSRRLTKLRSQHPLEYLSQDCLSRLQHLCGGPLVGDSRNA